MGDVTKQARLDNWAMFVMSRLQVFFNKTDYCDLTLQFEGNVQLKVHRVIMNACTEYFQLLEQTCEVIDDVLIMPPDLQADVILPIVNFMYTGILEYQQSIYDKLYRTAELMNMSVLLKFLDAQRMKSKPQHKMQVTMPQRKMSPKVDKLPATLPGRKLPIWKRKTVPVPVQINPVKPYSPEPRNIVVSDPPRFDNAPKPTRFEWPDEDIKDIKPFDPLQLDSSFDAISYTSKPLVTQEDELRAIGNSLFDDLRQLPISKPVKFMKDFHRESNTSSNMDMEDLKSYVKEQKIRSGLADFGIEDPDDPDYIPGHSLERAKRKLGHSQLVVKKPRLSNEKENLKETTRIITAKGGDSKVDHSKIISEVFKKYPHLVQKNKNIRLKILAKNKADDKEVKPKGKTTLTQNTSASQKTKLLKQTTSSVVQLQRQQKQLQQEQLRTEIKEKFTQALKKTREGETSWVCTKCTNNGEPIEFVLYYLYRKHMTDVHHRHFDARDCKHCGAMYERPLYMAYHMYMSHAVTPPRNIIFPKCMRCAFVALDKTKMDTHFAFHAANVRHSQCPNCKLGYINEQSLKVHMQLAGHNGKNNLSFDCQYCTRQLNSASSLFVHLRTTHFDDAKKDGMLSLDDCELEPDKVATTGETERETEPSNDLVATSDIGNENENENINENISGTLGAFDIVVLDEQQQYILPDDDVPQRETIENQQCQESYITLPELQDQSYNMNQTDIASTDELVMVLTDHDYNDGNNDTITDNSNIVVLYSHPVEGQQNQFIATTQGNLMLNSETGLLEIHNDTVPISTQGESIEMIQKEIDSHISTNALTTTTNSHKVLATAIETDPQHQIIEQVHHVKMEDMPDRKVSIIGVEQSGTGQLIDTIEEIEPATPDVPDYGTNTQEVQTFEEPDELAQETLPEPEPMEVDEDPDPKQESANATLSSIEETTEGELSQEFDIDPVGQNAQEIIEPPQIETTVPENEPTVTDTTDEKQPTVDPLVDTRPHPPTTSIELDCQPEAEIPPLLLEEEGSIPTTELIVDPSECEEADYKTSASLSIPEQCPEEPMEVDGTSKMQLPEEALPLVETPVSSEESIAQVASSLNETETQHGGEDVVEGPLLLSEIPLPEEPYESPSLSEIPLPGEVQCEEPVLPALEPTNETNKDASDADGTDGNKSIGDEFVPSENLDEVQGSNENIDQHSPEATQEVVNPEEDSTPEAEETLSKSTESIEGDSTEQAQDNDDTVQLEKEIKDKVQGISTLLHDWEDTDSQQSEQGKGTSVNKLINDWDDD